MKKEVTKNATSPKLTKVLDKYLYLRSKGLELDEIKFLLSFENNLPIWGLG